MVTNVRLKKTNFCENVIYQIITDRFYDGDFANNPKGDLYSSDKSNLKKYFGGDWKGIINKIRDGYFTDMGITAIWISPPVENVFDVMDDPQGSTSYHGYWAQDFKRTNPFFGSMRDFEELIATAHQKGIKIVIDFAPNHTSPASKLAPDYIDGKLFDDGSFVASYVNDPNGYFQHNGGTDFSSYEDILYRNYSDRNLYDLAGLNHISPFIDNYLKEAIILWLDKGIDGIRIDCVKHMPIGWLKSFAYNIYNYRPVFIFGEWFSGEEENDRLSYFFANNSGMSLLDFNFAQKIRQVLRNKTDNWYGFVEMIEETEAKYSRIIDQVTFIDNHDLDRFTMNSSDHRITEIALTVLLLSRGIPSIYYGTEQYMMGNGDPSNRKMMESFEQQTKAYQIIKILSFLRTKNKAIAYGDTLQRWINEDVLIFERNFEGNCILVAVNRNNNKSYYIDNLYTNLLKGEYSDYLNNMLDGLSIDVDFSGLVSRFELKSGAVAVWQHTTFLVEPIITHVAPTMGKHRQTITVDGQFGKKQGKVLFGKFPSEILFWNEQQIQINVPDSIPGIYDITVINDEGETSNRFHDFEILSGDQVCVRFIVENAKTEPGQNVYLVGNICELGNWDVQKAIGPLYNQVVYQYPIWYYDVSIPKGICIQYKIIKVNQQGTVYWEAGDNHMYINNSGPEEIRIQFNL